MFPASFLKLKRFNILGEDGNLTVVGENTLFDCMDEEKEAIPADDKFDEIWLAFPKDDEFKGFPRTRAIRTNKSAAKAEYHKALSKGHTHEGLLRALKEEIAYRSTSTKDNLFKFMRSPVNWFKLETYLDYEGEELTENLEYGKDIL